MSDLLLHMIVNTTDTRPCSEAERTLGRLSSHWGHQVEFEARLRLQSSPVRTEAEVQCELLIRHCRPIPLVRIASC